MAVKSKDIATEFRKQITMAFATPIVTFPWPDSDALNAELKALILENESHNAGLTRSNVGAWHSDLGIFSWDAECIRTLKNRVRLAAIELTRNTLREPNRRFTARYRIDGWANVVRSGQYHSAHNHPNNWWSGVYYVSIGEADPELPFNGQIELLDPRLGPNMVSIPDSIFELRYTVPTKEGLMVLFPSWLVHYVHPYVGTGERISIAFNVLAGDFKFVDESTA